MAAPKSFSVGKSWRDGCVAIKVAIKSYTQGTSVKVEASDTITSDAARALAADLLAAADEADAKVAKKIDEKNRREKYQQREIAAGRMKIMTPGEFFRR